jgi:glycerophosphoryl diester phosphodiesterase
MNSFSSLKLQVSSFALGRPLILGHRGAPLELTENTIASFRRALEEGADGVELDVRRTGDGTLVVFHDDLLRSGELLMDYSHNELRDLASAQGVTIHTLEEVFRELAGQGFLNIELKELGLEAAAVDLALAHLPPASFVFSSFLPMAVRECRRIAPDVPAIFVTDSCRDPERVFHLLADTDASGLGLWHEALTPAVGAFFTSRDVPLFVWTVNDSAEAKRLAELGIAGIITDVPGEIRKKIRDGG